VTVTFIQILLGAEADAVCGAGYGERSEERANSRIATIPACSLRRRFGSIDARK
jgi:transposase-like protein